MNQPICNAYFNTKKQLGNYLQHTKWDVYYLCGRHSTFSFDLDFLFDLTFCLFVCFFDLFINRILVS